MITATTWSDVMWALAPGLVLGLMLVALLGVYVACSAPRSELMSRQQGSALLPEILIGFWYWLVTPLIDSLARAGIRPNHVTFFSLSLAATAAIALGAGHFMLGTWLVVAAASCDLIDGLLARHTDSESKAGAFFDSFADRVAEGLVFAGIAVYGAGGALTWVALWAMFASVLVSYARARGESLGASCTSGLMQRPERLLALIVILFFSPLVAVLVEPGASEPVLHLAVLGVGLLAVLSTITAIRRAYDVFAALDDKPAEPTPSDESISVGEGILVEQN
jgi:CDP-diacylglycerol---glycerol-3-phosphate 3-phosphatidyltransferase